MCSGGHTESCRHASLIFLFTADMAATADITTSLGIRLLVLLTFASLTVYSDEFKEFNNAEGQIVCYECFNIVEGVFQPHCPKNDSVGPWTWKINCTGHCYTRTDDQNPDLIYRGCSDNQPFLPDPLPDDGCYPYYLETWCICGKNGCNGHAMGKPGKVELDAHLPKEPEEDYPSSAFNILTADIWILGLMLIYSRL